jgi:hypothetical protein
MIFKIVPSKQIGQILACLILLGCYHTDLLTAQAQDATDTPASCSPVHATHVLGFEAVSNNADGELSIQGDTLRFQNSAGSQAQILISSIQDLSLGEENKQMGGVPMALTRTAAPYGGGRVIGLFSHKKYDTVTLEYLDPNGGVHGAIFRLNNGQGQVLRNELEAKCAHFARLENETKKSSTQEVKNVAK